MRVSNSLLLSFFPNLAYYLYRSTSPELTKEENVWACLVGGAASFLYRLCFDQMAFQRYMASKNINAAQRCVRSYINRLPCTCRQLALYHSCSGRNKSGFAGESLRCVQSSRSPRQKRPLYSIVIGQQANTNRKISRLTHL